MSDNGRNALELLAVFNAFLLSINTLITVWNNLLARAVKNRQRRLLDEVLSVAESTENRR